jgi:chromate transporter
VNDGLGVVAREWLRLGAIGFGGPPTHIALLRRLCVEKRRWLSAREFEDAVAACNLLPGPASTQLAIFCAGRVAGRAGCVVGGVCFIAPGLALILALAVLFLATSPPDWVRGAAAGAGAAVAAVAVRAALELAPASVRRMRGAARLRWPLYALAGGVAAAITGPWVVLVLIVCGLAELAVGRRVAAVHATPALVALLATAKPAGLGALAWTALKVGALSFGGGFVIIPLMQSDAVHHFHWVSESQFTAAVALGQVTPGPVTQTVAAVGYAAHGLGGGLLAALVAFSPSFAFVLALRGRFEALRRSATAQAFLSGAGPAAIGAIFGAAVPLAGALDETWQFFVLGAAAIALILLRRGIVPVLVTAGVVGAIVGLTGGPLPH